MSDVERVIKFGEFLRAHPSLETFLIGFLCGASAAIVVYLVSYFVGEKCSKDKDIYTPRLQALTAFVSEQRHQKRRNDLYYFEIVDDNGTITYVCAKCRMQAIEIYCREKGCPKEWVKEHCVVRHINLLRSTNC